MFRNYLKVALRNLLKDRFYASINVIGLATGLGAAVVIIVYIFYQLSYDRQHPEYDRTYRVNQSAFWSSEYDMMSSTPIPLAGVLLDDYPEVEAVTRINTPSSTEVRVEMEDGSVKVNNESDILAADENFFDFFGIELLEGDKTTALVEVNSVVISGEIAKKYFGDENPLGKILLLGTERVPVRVTGITEKQPGNMHFDFDFLISMHTNPAIKKFEWSWIWTQMVTYVRLRPGTDKDLLETKFEGIAAKHATDAFRRLQIDINEFEAERGPIRFELQPLASIHLYSHRVGNRLGPIGDISYIYIFSAIALFLLIIAAINFTNLSTARSVIRAREIGIRKVLGSSKKQLITQYLSESLILAMCSAFIAFVALEVINGYTYQLMEIDVMEILTREIRLWPVLLMLPVLLGLTAGFYPAFYMTRFKPVVVLKGKQFTGGRGNGFRNLLVVFQFAISTSLIICSILVYNQLTYFNKTDLGFNEENVLVINSAEKLGKQLELFTGELRSFSGIENAGIAMTVPGRGGMEDFFHATGRENEEISMSSIKIDEQFISSMGMRMKAGRNFSEEFPGDVRNVIINESAMVQFGWDESNVIGQEINYFKESTYRVIGVVENFNYLSLRSSIDPLAFFHVDSRMWGDMRTVAIRYSGEDTRDVLDYAEKSWTKYSNEAPFDYSYLDQELEVLYQGERQTARLFSGFTLITVLISCIGLFGLSSYTVEQRRKEIGIRKVLGSSVRSVILLLNSSYTRLVILGYLIAVPVSWWAMDHWLSQFSYRIEIGPLPFILSGFLAMIIMWITVSYQSIKAATINPVESLKDE